MNSLWIGLISSLLAAIIIYIISFTTNPIKQKVFKFFKIDIGIRKYINWKKDQIYIFPKLQKTRISVSVLARIEKDGKYLLKSKQSRLRRQDATFKPLGGCIKMNDKIIKSLNSKFHFDSKTRYSAKNNDFRIYKSVKNNKLIHKAIYSNNVEYYKKELVREIIEETIINKKTFEKIFAFTHPQPYSVIVHYTEPSFSVLDEHDYVHHIVFNLKVIDDKEFKKVFKDKLKVKFIDLKGVESKAITSFLMKSKNEFRLFNSKKNNEPLKSR